MIKYIPKQDRRTFAEKHYIIFMSIIALCAVLALNSFHKRTQRKNTVKSLDLSILKTVSNIRANQ